MRQSILSAWLLLLFVGVAHANPLNLQTAVQSKAVDCQLTGDGTNTSSVDLKLTNKTPRDLNIRVPEFQSFVPADQSYQTMMTTEEQVVMVGAGETVALTTPTVCISGKDVPAPPPEDVGYQPRPHPQPEEHEVLVDIITTARELSEDGCFKELPLPEEVREQQISQMAIWTHLGRKTPRTEDDVNVEVLKQDIIEKAGLDPEKLTEKQEEQIDQGCEDIFASVDLTLKSSSKASGQSKDGDEELEDPPRVGQNGWTFYQDRLMRWVIADISYEETPLSEDIIELVRNELIRRLRSLGRRVPMLRTLDAMLEGVDPGDLYITWALIDEEGTILLTHVDVIHYGEGRGDIAPFLTGDQREQQRVLRRMLRDRERWLRNQRNAGNRLF